ncbi:kinase-like protein, partial [Thelephora ganbajun]
LRRLQSICSNRAMLPLSHLIPSESISNKGEAIASGGFSNVHQAEFDGKKVCIKVLRLYAQDTSDFTKKTFYREVVVWKRLQHPNIVPFLGVPAREPPPLEIICDWMENSRVTEYVRANPKVDCTNLLWDVVDGLHYLHSCNVIHGNLKGANILIDKDGHARLADFGLTSIIRGEDSTRSPQDSNTNNTTTWAAPEILKEGSVSKEGDVFTFAMVTVEIFTGHAPFVKNYQSAIFDIISGKRPQRPHKLHHDGLWQLVQRCWNEQPGERPTSSQLLEFFQTS